MRIFSFIALLAACLSAQAQASQPATGKMKILVHVTEGVDNPTVAALAFLVARTAIEEGHTVNLFLAGDATLLMKDDNLNTLAGLGTGKLREHYESLAKAGAKFYLSGMSSKARNVTDKDIAGKPAEFAMPTILLKLSLESDRMFVY